jgi:hypothetical protein
VSRFDPVRRARAMTAVPTIRPYATRDEWRRDFHDGVANMFDGDDTPTPDVWDVLDRETGEFLGRVAVRNPDDYVSAESEYGTRVVLENRRTREVVYGRGVQS